MSSATPKIGQIFWSDVSAKDADTLKDFYKEIFGWKEHAVKMKDENGTEYNDYAMMIDEETAAGGVCHKKGVNQHIPSQWIM